MNQPNQPLFFFWGSSPPGSLSPKPVGGVGFDVEFCDETGCVWVALLVLASATAGIHKYSSVFGL